MHSRTCGEPWLNAAHQIFTDFFGTVRTVKNKSTWTLHLSSVYLCRTLFYKGSPESIRYSLNQCCGSGSESGSGSTGSGSTCFWASWIRIRIHQSEVGMDPDPDLDPSITKQKKEEKPWFLLLFVTSFWLFIFENDVPSISKQQKNLRNKHEIFLFSFLLPSWEGQWRK